MIVLFLDKRNDHIQQKKNDRRPIIFFRVNRFFVFLGMSFFSAMIKIMKIFAKIIREAPGFFGGPSSLDHEGVSLMKIFCKSGSGSQPYEKVPGRKKPERAQVH